tara:strand:- start:108521 stop:109864 length:1344 start_codon:yes stop_codon:yes gene_type:complete
MSKDYENSTFKELLDKLQQESWQLELLISGFAIFGLFSATEPIGIKLEIAEHSQHLAETLIWFAAKICCWILISNLLIHVILRGLWIGALGLRYVSGDIDYDVLKYSPKFTKYLQRKIGSFDKYIATLEDYCSVLFAVSFLFVFYFLASFAFVVFLLMIALVFLDNDASGSVERILEITGIVLIIFTLIGMFLTFVDFITQGFLKRKKWTTFFYFPIYRIFSIITLSFLYRPLVYNLLDNKFGKKLSFVLVPVYVFILYLFTHSYIDSNYIKVDRNSSTYYANPGNYEDLIVEENDFINVATIPSKVITDSYMKVFMIFNENLEERLFSFNPGLKPKEDRRGLKSEIVFFGDFDREEYRKRDSLRLVYYKTFNDVHKVSIDGKKQETTFITSTTKNKKLGFETYINIDTLKDGKHLLKISRKYINKKKDTVRNILVSIPFWKFNTDK